jgi:hypothetical protein
MAARRTKASDAFRRYNNLTAATYSRMILGVPVGMDCSWRWFVRVFEPIILYRLERHRSRPGWNPLPILFSPPDIVQQMYLRIMGWTAKRFGADKEAMLHNLQRLAGWLFRDNCRRVRTRARDYRREERDDASLQALATPRIGPDEVAAAADEIQRRLAECSQADRPIVQAYLGGKTIPNIAGELSINEKRARTVVKASAARANRRAEQADVTTPVLEPV